MKFRDNPDRKVRFNIDYTHPSRHWPTLTVSESASPITYYYNDNGTIYETARINGNHITYEEPNDGSEQTVIRVFPSTEIG